MVPVTGRVLDAEEKGAARRRILARLIQAWAVAAGAPFFLSGWWRATGPGKCGRPETRC